MPRVITLILPNVLLEKLDDHRKALGISRSEFLRSLIIKELEKNEKNL
jgi:metal-responsive CopG/Arc/MetJ family transcriptional regulator